MGEKPVGLEILIYLDEMKVAARIFARAAGAGFAVTNDAAPGGQQIRLREWTQRKNHAGGIAAGISHQSSLGNFTRVEFGDSVDGLRKPFGVGCGQFVPGSKSRRFVKAERAAEVHHAQTGVEQSRRQLRGNFMRSREKRGARVAGRDGVNRKSA